MIKDDSKCELISLIAKYIPTFILHKNKQKISSLLCCD